MVVVVVEVVVVVVVVEVVVVVVEVTLTVVGVTVVVVVVVVVDCEGCLSAATCLERRRGERMKYLWSRGRWCGLTVAVVVAGAIVVVWVVLAVYVFVVVVIASTKAPQTTEEGYTGGENLPGLPGGGHLLRLFCGAVLPDLPRIAGTAASASFSERFLG